MANDSSVVKSRLLDPLAKADGCNMYGCQPCPVCRSTKRYPDQDWVVQCDDCGQAELAVVLGQDRPKVDLTLKKGSNAFAVLAACATAAGHHPEWSIERFRAFVAETNMMDYAEMYDHVHAHFEVVAE